MFLCLIVYMFLKKYQVLIIFKILCESQHMLNRMNHRGGCQCSSENGTPSGDGAGVLTAIPHKLYKKFLTDIGYVSFK